MGIQNRLQRSGHARLAGKIAKLVETDVHEAIQAAIRGKALNSLESHFLYYFQTSKELSEVKTGKRKFFVQEVLEDFGPKWSKQEAAEHLKSIEFVVQKVESELAAEFVFCLRQKDFEYMKILIKTAQQMARFREESDRLRMLILSLKLTFERSGKALTIREVAQRVGLGKAENIDGFSALRRICNELKFPLAASRKLKRFAK